MSFTFLFYQHIIFRHSCGKCHFTNTSRPSDITLADFWGWEKTDPHINADDKGISLVLCNTQKGKLLFDAVKGNMHVIPTKLENCLQTHLKKPSDIHPKRMALERDYEKYGFEHTFRKYALIGWKHSIHRKVSALKDKMKNIRKLIFRGNI